MVRPRCPRRVGCLPARYYFKPCGVPVSQLEENVLTVDELEALRLADLEGLYQDRAAETMSVSRQTFGRIIEQARRKVADSLVRGKAVRIEGGDVELDDPEMAQACGCCGESRKDPERSGSAPGVRAQPDRGQEPQPERAREDDRGLGARLSELEQRILSLERRRETPPAAPDPKAIRPKPGRARRSGRTASAR